VPIDKIARYKLLISKLLSLLKNNPTICDKKNKKKKKFILFIFTFSEANIYKKYIDISIEVNIANAILVASMLFI
jgi:hypothetical protein